MIITFALFSIVNKCDVFPFGLKITLSGFLPSIIVPEFKFNSDILYWPPGIYICWYLFIIFCNLAVQSDPPPLSIVYVPVLLILPWALNRTSNILTPKDVFNLSSLNEPSEPGILFNLSSRVDPSGLYTAVVYVLKPTRSPFFDIFGKPYLIVSSDINIIPFFDICNYSFVFG